MRSLLRFLPTPASQFLLGGLPVLLFGWVASALANRLSFVAWGLLVAAGYGAMLSQGWRLPWRGAPAAAPWLWLALGWSFCSWLVGQHSEVLGLGWRAFLPSLYLPLWQRPWFYLVLAAGCLGGAAVVASRSLASPPRQ